MPLIAALLILGVDSVFARSNPGPVPTGLLDEPAHVATAVIAAHAVFLAHEGESLWRMAVLAGAVVGRYSPT